MLNIKSNIPIEVPNVIFIGNTAFDIVDFRNVDSSKGIIKNVGGACIFSAVPASLFYRVGVVTKVGKDFDVSEINKYNINCLGLKVLDNRKTTEFYTMWNTSDGQNRTIIGEVQTDMKVTSQDIPKEFLSAKHFHLTTADPKVQLELIKFLRKNTDSTISVDTIDDFIKDPCCKEVFDSVDVAFIDKEYKELLDCKSKVKIIKYGKKGCIYYSNEKNFPVYAKVLENVVDKTGAGDCLNGVFINLIKNGVDERIALQEAVNVATESIKRYGILSLEYKSDRFSEKEL